MIAFRLPVRPLALPLLFVRRLLLWAAPLMTLLLGPLVGPAVLPSGRLVPLLRLPLSVPRTLLPSRLFPEAVRMRHAVGPVGAAPAHN